MPKKGKGYYDLFYSFYFFHKFCGLCGASLPNVKALNSCELSCKTKVPLVGKEAGVSGHTGQYTNSTNSFEHRYKTCIDKKCPLSEPDESIVMDCQCISEFGSAASSMGLIEFAGKDLICSSGKKL